MPYKTVKHSGVVSFRVEWTSSGDKHAFHDAASGFDANVVFNSAKGGAERRRRRPMSPTPCTSASLFAEVGHERNGVYFPAPNISESHSQVAAPGGYLVVPLTF